MIESFKKNDLFTAEIADMTNTGAGICHLDGIAVFVPGAVDGDIIDGKIIKLYSNYMIGRIEKIITPSKFRSDSDVCPVSKQCGGCAFRHISYEHELEIKKRSVQSAFKKVGLDVMVHDVLSGASVDGWRNKVQIPVLDGYRLGYYSRHSHNIVENSFCPAHESRINEILGFFSERLKNEPINVLRHICLRASSEGILICLVCQKESDKAEKLLTEIYDNFDDVKGALININDKDTNVIFGDSYKLVCGSDHIVDILLDMKFRISIQSFYQVNKEAAEIAYQKLFDISDVGEGDRILDLYCGTGTIGLFFAKCSNAKKLLGVDITSSSIRDAVTNAKSNNIQNANFICSDSSEINISDYYPDILIVDPPRKGLSNETIDKIKDALPNKISYMSCNANTLARDCKTLSELGYRIKEVFPVNMFPRSEHVETVVLLSRKNIDDHLEFTWTDKEFGHKIGNNPASVGRNT